METMKNRQLRFIALRNLQLGAAPFESSSREAALRKSLFDSVEQFSGADVGFREKTKTLAVDCGLHET
jgi:hypothetical protein